MHCWKYKFWAAWQVKTKMFSKSFSWFRKRWKEDNINEWNYLPQRKIVNSLFSILSFTNKWKAVIAQPKPCPALLSLLLSLSLSLCTTTTQVSILLRKLHSSKIHWSWFPLLSDHQCTVPKLTQGVKLRFDNQLHFGTFCLTFGITLGHWFRNLHHFGTCQAQIDAWFQTNSPNWSWMSNTMSQIDAICQTNVWHSASIWAFSLLITVMWV